MDQRNNATARLAPLPPEHAPELREQFERMKKNLGWVPNSILIMQRVPKLAKAFAALTASVWDPESKVDRGFKRLIAHVSSRAAGCQYCMAHTAGGALHFGIEDEKLAAVWDYQTSPLFSAAERAAWRQWSPLMISIPGASRWPGKDRRALAEVVRAKAGPREAEFQRRLLAHSRLCKALTGA